MKIVVNDGYYGCSFKITDEACAILKDDPKYKCEISDHVKCIDILGATRYLIMPGWYKHTDDLRTNETLIKLVEEEKPYGMAIIDIPDEATDWIVITNRLTDDEEIAYTAEGRIFIKGIYKPAPSIDIKEEDE